MADINITVDVTSISQAKKVLTDFQGTVNNMTVVKLATGVEQVKRNIEKLIDAKNKSRLSADAYNLGLLQAKRALEQFGLSSQKATAVVRRFAQEQEKEAQATAKLAQAKARAETAFALGKQRAEEEARAIAQLNAARQQQAQREDFLRQKYDEGYRALVIYRTQITELNDALQLGVINQTQYAQRVDVLNQQMADGSILMLNASQKSRAGLNQFGMMTQQVGYQVGDFLVQVQSGTNWIVALGQQATQVAGTLTQFGGNWLYIGAVLSVVIPLATALGGAWMRTRGEVEETEDSVKDLDTALQGISNSLRDWNNEKRAGDLGITVEQLLGIDGIESAEDKIAKTLLQLQKLRGEISKTGNEGFLETFLDEIQKVEILGGKPFEGVIVPIRLLLAEDAMGQAEQALIDAQEQLTDQLAMASEKELGTLNEKLLTQEIYNDRLGQGLSEIEAMAQAQFDVRKMTLETALAAEGLTEEQRMAVRAALDLLIESEKVKKELREAEENTQLIEQGISQAVIDAARLAGIDFSNLSDAATDVFVLASNMGILVEEAAALRLEQGKLDRLNENAGRGSTSSKPVSWGDGTPVDVKKPRRGGGGGSNPIEQLRSQYDNLMGSMDPLIAAQNEFNAQQKMLNEALAAGAINGKEFEVAMAAITQKLQEAKDPLRDFKAGLEDALDPEKNYIKGLEALQSSLADFLFNPFEVGLDGMVLSFSRALQKMASEALAAGFMKMLLGGAGGGGGLFGGLFGFANGGVFSGGNVRPFANGGVVSAPTNFPIIGNQMGLMGESGPEAIMPLKRASNGKLGVAAEGNSGSKSMKIINVLDSRIVGEYLNTPEGEEVIMNVMRRTGVV